MTNHSIPGVLAGQPVITLNNGVELPALGFGVFQTPPDVTQAAVEEALRVGYRLVDTAASYLNEPEVGAAIAASGLDRAELFVQTKVWVSNYSYDGALHAFDVSTRKLGVDYLDLYLLHQPLPQDFDATVAAYRALERLLEEGRTRAIGISNFSPAHLDTFLPRISIVPAVNQVEVHPYYSQPQLREAHARLGIATQAWSPLGGVYVYRPSDADAPKRAITDPVITAIAERHAKSAAQVVLRWHIDRGRSAIPKSIRPARIAENFEVFDFSLSPDEIALIDALDTGVRGGPNQDALDFRTLDRPIPE
ncbi:MAG TPA: aldo/keto reductase [Candidatus Limnocylindrales bacterium]|nr:aldo/keto reductase [Candidatus Limnocylindrales bacterium]